MTVSQNLTSAEVDRGDEVPFSIVSVTDVPSPALELNSFKILKELLASSNKEGIIDGEDLLAVLLLLSILFTSLLVELAISLRVSMATPANH